MPLNSTDIEVEEITIANEPSSNCGSVGTLYGVFWSHCKAMQYAESLRFNFPNDFSSPKR
jgi:hypothetical protein